MIDKGQGTENRELELGTPTNPWTTALAMSGAPRVAESWSRGATDRSPSWRLLLTVVSQSSGNSRQSQFRGGSPRF